jgi:hypothetical protein
MAIGKDAILKYLIEGNKLFGKKYIGYHVVLDNGCAVKCNERSIDALINSGELIVSGEHNEQLILGKNYEQ